MSSARCKNYKKHKTQTMLEPVKILPTVNAQCKPKYNQSKLNPEWVSKFNTEESCNYDTCKLAVFCSAYIQWGEGGRGACIFFQIYLQILSQCTELVLNTLKCQRLFARNLIGIKFIPALCDYLFAKFSLFTCTCWITINGRSGLTSWKVVNKNCFY